MKAITFICWRRRKKRRRSTVSLPICRRRQSPDPQLLGDFFVYGEITLGALAELYGLEISDDEKEITDRRLFHEASVAQDVAR